MTGACPHCGAGVLVEKGGRAKLRTSIVILHTSGEVEANCPACKQGVILPCRTIPEVQGLKKAESCKQKLFVPLDKVTKNR